MNKDKVSPCMIFEELYCIQTDFSYVVNVPIHRTRVLQNLFITRMLLVQRSGLCFICIRMNSSKLMILFDYQHLIPLF